LSDATREPGHPPHPPNHLAGEASPYLLQHAHNPVDWYPWGPEALGRAVAEDKPILLSIGYSACHWCHVMERESFEDVATARLMNDQFINIKVDREERPDLDQIYQLVVQLMRRSGGWPLTVFLTPQQKPFYAGTYFPPEDRYGMPAFSRILTLLADAYRERRSDVELQATELVTAIGTVSRADTPGDAKLGPDLLERATAILVRRFDDENGGFGDRPKFPNTMPLDVLLRRGALEGDDRTVARVERALGGMRGGGIFDQLGGGFHRYSTDAKWLVPHFEKMLYDNALLLRLYVDAYRVTHDARWAETASRVADYVVREMVSPDGGFYASQDADSEGEEGRFFVWDRPEMLRALGGDDALTDLACARYGVTDDGNFEETGKTVLHESRSPESLAIKLGRAPSEVKGDLDRAVASLHAAREARPKPFRDEKILASWNGLMIGAMAEASRVLDRPELLVVAERAFAYEDRVLVDDGRVLRLAKGSVVKRAGFLDDQAFVACASLDLYEATGAPTYIAKARTLVDALLAHFADAAAGGFFFTPDDGEALLHRAKDPYDQAIPSGASLACLALLRLGALVGEPYAARAATELERVAPSALENPFAYGQTLAALDRLVRGSVDVVLVGPRDDARIRAFADVVYRAYLPNRALAWLDPADPASLAACAELASGKETQGAPVAFVCRGRTCSLPLTSPDNLARELGVRG
jgi:uncharacterized protein YyaL (SSP411 family)